MQYLEKNKSDGNAEINGLIKDANLKLQLEKLKVIDKMEHALKVSNYIDLLLQQNSEENISSELECLGKKGSFYIASSSSNYGLYKRYTFRINDKNFVKIVQNKNLKCKSVDYIFENDFQDNGLNHISLDWKNEKYLSKIISGYTHILGLKKYDSHHLEGVSCIHNLDPSGYLENTEYYAYFYNGEYEDSNIQVEITEEQFDREIRQNEFVFKCADKIYDLITLPKRIHKYVQNKKLINNKEQQKLKSGR